MEQNQKIGTKKDKIELLRKRLKIFQERKGLTKSDFCKEINFDSNEFSKIINGHKKTIDAYLIGQIITRYEDTDARWFFMEESEMKRIESAKGDLASKNGEKIETLSNVVVDLLNELRSVQTTVNELAKKINQ